MGKRNKKAKASAAEANSTVNNKPTPTVVTKASKNGNESKQKRTKDSERPKCRGHYFVALFVAIVSVIIIFVIPNVSSILETSERPSFSLLTPYAEVDTMKETNIKDEKFKASSAEDNHETDQDSESFDTHFEDADREVESRTYDLHSGDEDTSSTLDKSNLREYNNAAGESSTQSTSSEKIEEEPSEAHDFDESVEEKQSETYYTSVQDNDRIYDTSTYTTHHDYQEGLDSEEKSEPEEIAIMPVDDSIVESNSSDEFNEHQDREISEDDSVNTEQERRIDQENDNEVSDDIETDETETSQSIDTTTEDDATQSAEKDDSSVQKQSEYQDDSMAKSSGEANKEGDVDITNDNFRLIVDVNSQQIDKRDDSLKQAQIDITDDTTAETMTNEIDSNQDDNRLEIPSENANDEFSEQTNEDASIVDVITKEDVTEMLDSNQDETDLEASGAIDISNNQEEDQQLTRHVFDKEKIDMAETPQTATEETVVSTSKGDDQDKEIEPGSDVVIPNHQEREVENTEPDEVKTGKPESEKDKIVDEEEDFDDEDEDEDGEEANDISAETKDEATGDENEEIKEIFFPSIETDSNDSDENYMDVSKGVRKRILKMGTGEKIDAGDMITIHCIGYLDEDPPKKFWSTKDPSQRPFTFAVGKRQVIKGWDEGALSMTLHERSRIKIEPTKAYGKFGFEAWGIPPGARIIFEMEVIEHKRMKSR